MPKTVEQILSIHVQHEERSRNGIEIALANSNAALVSFNVRQAFKACLMQGLIGWRCGLLSPVGPFREAIRLVLRGKSIVNAANELPLDQSSFLEILLNEATSAVATDGLVADRLLDAVLGNAMQGHWNEDEWNLGVAQLRKIKGSALACDTYSAYRQLLFPSSDAERKTAAETAVTLFQKRSRNGFYSGGEGTEGGGSDNAITVDYRLGAMLKKAAFTFDSIHSWKW
jgi:hypothetical protein